MLQQLKGVPDLCHLITFWLVLGNKATCSGFKNMMIWGKNKYATYVMKLK